jgi:7-cyano-7-deazaguanine synthase
LRRFDLLVFVATCRICSSLSETGEESYFMKRAVVLLSGGIDSSTTLACAGAEGFECYALTVSYGQRNRWEISSARAVAESLKAVEHREITVDLGQFGGSALTGGFEVPKGRSDDALAGGIPITYVPARNTIMLSLALGWAEVLCSFDIFIGVNAVDYSGYPDCRPAFIKAFEELANTATKAAVEGRGTFTVHAPLIHLSKAEIIRHGVELGVDFSLTTSCYDPPGEGIACGRCDSCLLRKRGFEQAGVKDPARYVEGAG